MKRYLFAGLIVSLLAPLSGWGQGCNSPLSICQSDGSAPYDTYEGTLTPLPGDFCFAPVNIIFIAFNTLSQDYIESAGVTFQGNAQIQISGLNCDTTQFGTVAISAGVAPAGNPCIPNSYGPAVDCVPPTLDDNLTLTLTDLLPDTTYYLIINTEVIENSTAFNCDFDVEITGPAVQYNLGATATPQTIINGQSSVLSANEGFNNYEWSGGDLEGPTDGQSITVSPDVEAGDFVYTVTADVDGCEQSAQVLVTVQIPITVFNTFTPNGDGFNDQWIIQGIDRFPDAEVLVYSRWGQLVYRSRNFTGWDGGNLPTAVYYYVIDLNPLGFDTRPITGSVTLVR